MNEARMIYARAYRHGRIVAGHSVDLPADFDEASIGYEAFAEWVAEGARKAHYWAPDVPLDVAIWLGPAGPLKGPTPSSARVITCAAAIDARRRELIDRATPFLVDEDADKPHLSPSKHARLHHVSCARLDAAVLAYGHPLTAREASMFLGARRDTDRRCRFCMADRVPSGSPHTP